jgi:integrase
MHATTASTLGQEHPPWPAPTPETSPGPGTTVAEYLSRWLAHAKARVRATTHDGYEGLIRLYALPRIGQRELASLRPLDLQDLYAELLASGSLKAGTVLNLHLVLTQALNQAVRWGILPANPAKGAQPPRPIRPEPRVVDEALAVRLLAATRDTSFEIPVAIALGTGMRRGEILALRWSDLDTGLGMAQVRRSVQTSRAGLVVQEPKTRRSRRAVALPEVLRPYLRRQRADQRRRRAALGAAWQDLDLVVDRGDGGYLNPDTLSSGWATFCRRVGFAGIRFHDLRHGHATLLLLQGVHPKIVSERLGHASIGITLDLYSHVLPSMQAEAARAFDRLFDGSSSPSAVPAG